MTEQEALDYFKRRKEQLGISDKIQQAETLAISALEKQIPKKPIVNSEICHYVDYQDLFCPCCRNRIISRIDGDFIAGRKQQHCDKCGQALDWSECNG